MRELLNIAIDAALSAGGEIMRIYEDQDFEVATKFDESPITIADRKANEIITSFLSTTNIPIISEESEQVPFEIRKTWESCWIVDPLDGTKEFIKRNGEFTVNIALVQHGDPILGVILIPATKQLYFSIVNEGKAYTKVLSDFNSLKGLQEVEELHPKASQEYLRIVGSRSHLNLKTKEFISQMKLRTEKEVVFIEKGSSLKFTMLAEGNAELYPRFSPTMEWDTAAGHAICNAVGLKLIANNTGEEMIYNRKDMVNGGFMVSSINMNIN